MTAGSCPTALYTYALTATDQAGNSGASKPISHPYRHGEEAGPHLDGPRVLLAVRQRDQDPGPDHPVPGRDDGRGLLHHPGPRSRRTRGADLRGTGESARRGRSGTASTTTASGLPTASTPPRFVVSYSNGSKPTAETTPFFVDNHVPKIDVSADALLFSPTAGQHAARGDDQADAPARKTCGKGRCATSAGQKVRGWFWKGNAADVAWDGKDDNGNLMPDGYYTYVVKATSKAGITTTKELRGIQIDTRPTPVYVTVGFERLLAERGRLPGHDRLQPRSSP